MRLLEINCCKLCLLIYIHEFQYSAASVTHLQNRTSHPMFNASLFALHHAETESQFATKLAGIVASRNGFHQFRIAIELHQLSTGTALAMESHRPGQYERLALELRPSPRNQSSGPHHPFFMQFGFHLMCT